MSEVHTDARPNGAAPPPAPSFKVTDDVSAGRAIAALVLDDDLKLPDPDTKPPERDQRSDPREPRRSREPDAGAEPPPTGATEDEPGEGDPAEQLDEEEAPPAAAIDPPASWPADAKADFAKLPPTLQQTIATRESQREAYVTQRAQEASDQRKAADAARAEAANQGAAYLDGLQRMRLMLLPEVEQLRQVDWLRLQSENPTEFARLRTMGDVLGQRLQLVDQIMANEAQNQAQQRATLFEQRREEERAALHKKVPDFVDPVRRSAIREDLTKYLLGKGFTEQELTLAIDHRSLDVAYDALRWRQMQDARKAAEERRNNPAPALQRSGSSQPANREGAAQTRVRQAAQQLGRTHGEREAGKLLSLLL